MTKYNVTTLANGLRVIHLPSVSPVVYCGIGINAGARHEASGEEGLAHFCEHTTFKGTRRRSALQILNALESVGGDLNAFTNKEDTVFYAAIQREHFSRAVDLLCDIVFCSEYPQHEIEREIDVICDEIESYNDSPAELIYDEFENLIFRGHPLGHNILGTRQQVQQFTSFDARRFTQRYYRPDNAIFFVYGDIDFSRLVKNLEVRCEKFEARDYSSYAPQPQDISLTSHPSPLATESSHHQAHVMLGVRTFSYDDPRRMPLFLLNNILGGPGMNARLNLSLRERHGLVYTVESSQVSYSDTGCWSVYFGCDHHDVKRCLRLVHRELDRLLQHPLSDRQLQAAKRQLKGQLAIACDNREQFALDFAKHFLHYGHERSIAELLQRIDAITSSQIQDVAQQFFTPDKLQLLVL
ncbi:MAG: insulinase family protein [Prevotella sp.]|jgi:predicted Zn-dependent peptidase|nr:insulinase family protein [Prevotella sp.]